METDKTKNFMMPPLHIFCRISYLTVSGFGDFLSIKYFTFDRNLKEEKRHHLKIVKLLFIPLFDFKK